MVALESSCCPGQVRVGLVVTVTFPLARRPNRRQSEGSVSNVPSKYPSPVASCAVYGRMTSDREPTNQTPSRDPMDPPPR